MHVGCRPRRPWNWCKFPLAKAPRRRNKGSRRLIVQRIRDLDDIGIVVNARCTLLRFRLRAYGAAGSLRTVLRDIKHVIAG